ncbi:MAG: extracellular solute-binding protein [Armatimonadetes bacterium]|nr:extracellular solute-binding protein [Armatimonadota bacterium]
MNTGSQKKLARAIFSGAVRWGAPANRSVPHETRRRLTYSGLVVRSGLTLTFLLGAGIALLCGCARRPTTPVHPPASVAPAQTRKTKIALWTIWNAEPRKSALDHIVAEFQREHTDLAVEVTRVEPDAYKTAIRVRLGSDEPPDIFFVWDGEWLRNFVRAGAVYDLTDLMNADGGKWKSRLVPESLKRFTYRGRVWGVPYLLQCTFFLYNKEIFARLGLTVPKTWPELLTTIDKIRAAGLIPIALGNQQRWPAHHFVSVLWQRLMGEEAVEEDYDPLGPGDYSEPAWLRGLDMFAEMLKHKPFNDGPNAVTRESARALFYSGKAAMFYTGTWDFARLSEGGEAPRSFWNAWDFFNFPAVPGGKGDQAALTGAPDGYVVSARSKNAKAAVEFLRFMTRTDIAQQFVKACQELVQVKGAVTQDNANLRLRKYAAMVAAARQICPWSDTLMERSVADELLNGVQALLDGQRTPEQILARVRQAQAEARKRIASGEL